MPISVIEKTINSNFANIDFKAKNIEYTATSNLKRSILNDTNISIEIVEKNKFYIYIRFVDFHEILVNNFYYNNRRFKIQICELNKLKSSKSIAWFLITMYYGAFFASNEISNLAGYFNFNFDQSEKDILFNKNKAINHHVSLEFKNSEIKNFFGELSLCDEPNTIKITCINGGGKPHELSWSTLVKLLKSDTSYDADVFARTSRFKNILTSDKKWKRPNRIRNEWNYSRAELYTEDDTENLSDIQKYFNNYKELKRWAETRQDYSRGISDDIVSVMFVLNVLEKVMLKLETKLLWGKQTKNEIKDINKMEGISLHTHITKRRKKGKKKK